MGWCHEFGTQVCEGCAAPMVAGPSSCTCAACGTVCTGKFAGCSDVWARGPRSLPLAHAPDLPPLEQEGGDTVLAPAHALHDGPVYEAVPVAIDTSNPPPQTVATVLFDAVTALREDVEELTASVAGLSAPGEGENEPDRDQAPDGATQELFLTRLEQITFRLGQSLGQTSASLTDLNNETARVAAVGELAHESLAVARHIERTCAQIDQHLEELVRRLDAFGARLDRLIGPAAEGTNGDTPVATSPPAAVPPVT